MVVMMRPGVRRWDPSLPVQVMSGPPIGGVLPWWNPDGATPAANTGAWLAKGAASLDASYLNLGLLGNADIDPAVVGGVAPTWLAGTGWIFDGATTYLDTGLAPATPQPNFSVIVRFSGVPASGGVLTGWRNDGNEIYGLRIPGWSGIVTYYNSWNLSVAPDMTNGTLAVAGANGYRDGVVEPGNIVNIGGISGAMFIGAISDWGVPLIFLTGNIQAIAAYNVGLTGPQVLARHTEMMLL